MSDCCLVHVRIDKFASAGWVSCGRGNAAGSVSKPTMTTKVVYFTVGGFPEQAEFSSDDTLDNVRGSLRSCLCRWWI